MTDATEEAPPTKVILVKTWECVACHEDVPQGEPCPTCGKSLLLD